MVRRKRRDTRLGIVMVTAAALLSAGCDQAPEATMDPVEQFEEQRADLRDAVDRALEAVGGGQAEDLSDDAVRRCLDRRPPEVHAVHARLLRDVDEDLLAGAVDRIAAAWGVDVLDKDRTAETDTVFLGGSGQRLAISATVNHQARTVGVIGSTDCHLMEDVAEEDTPDEGDAGPVGEG